MYDAAWTHVIEHTKKLGAVIGLFEVDRFFSKKKLRDAVFVELNNFLLVHDGEST